MNNYANYLYIAIRAALDAGKAIMDIYTDPESDFGIERKADNSPLTKADKKALYLSGEILSARLRDIFQVAEPLRHGHQQLPDG